MSRKINKITYQGVTYSNEKEMCKALNFPYNTYVARKRKGMLLEERLNTPVGNSIVYQGVTYPNEKEMCKALNFPYGTYLARKNKGMPLDKISFTPDGVNTITESPPFSNDSLLVPYLNSPSLVLYDFHSAKKPSSNFFVKSSFCRK